MQDEPNRLTVLVERVKTGDEHAARELIESLYPRVIRIVRANLPRAMDEEDLTQEIFMKVFAKIDQFRGSQDVTHWAAKLALHTCYDRLRAQRAKPELRYADLSVDQAEFLEKTLAAKPVESQSGGTPGIAKDLVEQLLATLKPAEQLVIRLLDLEQKSVAEISELTNWGASKIKVTAMRARKKLRNKLDHLEKGTHQKLAE